MQAARPRARAVLVDHAALSAARTRIGSGRTARLTLNLFHDVEAVAVLDRTEATRDGFSLSGSIAGHPGSTAAMVVNGPVAAGVFSTPKGTWRLAYGGARGHRITAASAAGSHGSGDTESHEPRLRPGAGQPTPPGGAADDGAEVDVLFVYTPAARRRAGGPDGMRANVELALLTANEALRAGDARLRFTLAGAAEVDYVEPGFDDVDATTANLLREDLRRLGAQEHAGAVHALRDSYAADAVHLIVDRPGGGGTAWNSINTPAPSRHAFSVSSGSSPLVVAHELGHVMGLRHDRYVDPGNDPYPYSHGYVNQRAFDTGAPVETRWRTIMATGNQCIDADFHGELGHCPPVLRYSNPRQRHPATGEPLGVPGDEASDALDGPADAVRSLDNTAATVARFRDRAARCAYALSAKEVVVDAPGATVAVAVSAGERCTWEARPAGDFLSLPGAAAGNGRGEVRVEVAANDGGGRIGYVTVAGETLTVKQRGARQPMRVCDRTPQVGTAIAAASARGGCGDVDEFDLAGIVHLNLAASGISELHPRDFDGLGNLRALDLSWNDLRRLPAGIFEGLSGLRVLDLGRNAIETLQPALFSDLAGLWTLRLDFNEIAELPPGLFAGMAELSELALGFNALSGLPHGVFADLGGLAYLGLSYNSIAGGVLHRDAFRGLHRLARLGLSDNPLGADLPGDVFFHLTSLAEIHLSNARLTSLPTFYSDLASIDADENEIGSLAAGELSGRRISRLNLAGNRLRAIPDGFFAGFSSRHCRTRNFQLDLRDNPGAPFVFRLELARVDAPRPAMGPASVAVRTRSGAPLPLTAGLRLHGATSGARSISIGNGVVEGAAVEVRGDGPVTARLLHHASLDLPATYKGIRVELGPPIRLFALDDRPLELGAPLRLDLVRALSGAGERFANFTAVSSRADVASVSVSNGVLTVTPLRVGSATIAVTARDAAGATMNRSFVVTVDHGDTEERATLLPFGTPVHGTLADAADVDVFRLDLAGDAAVELRTSGSTDTRGELSDAGGVVIASDEDGGPGGRNFRIERSLPAGIYYAAVRGAAGGYSLTARLADALDQGDTAATSMPLKLHDARDLARAPRGILLGAAGRIRPASDVDVFRLDVPRDAVTVTVRTAGSPVHASLVDSSGTELASDGRGNAWIEARLDAGAYYVPVSGTSSGGYRILAWGAPPACPCAMPAARDHGGSPESSTLLRVGGAPAAGSIADESDVDVFRFDLAGDARVSVQTGGRTDTRGELFDASGASIASDDAGGPGGHNFRIEANLDAGIHYVRVTGAAGDYSVGARLADAFDQGAAAATSALLPLLAAAEFGRVSPAILLGTSGRIWPSSDDIDAFRLDVAGVGTLVTIRSSGTPLHARLVDGSLREVASQHRAGKLGIETELDAGIYYLLVGGRDVGGYRILAAAGAPACACAE